MLHQLCSIQVNLGVQRVNDAGLIGFCSQTVAREPRHTLRQRFCQCLARCAQQTEWNNTALIIVNITLTELTPWSRVLLEKLTGPQLVEKIHGFYGTRRFITAFTRGRQLFLSWATAIQSNSWRSILILSFHLSLGLPSGLFPSHIPTEPLYSSPVKIIQILLSVMTEQHSVQSAQQNIELFPL